MEFQNQTNGIKKSPAEAKGDCTICKGWVNDGRGGTCIFADDFWAPCCPHDKESTELLPCKKCGGEAEIVSSRLVNEAFSDASCVARCRSCGNRTDMWYSDEDAAKSWNRRNGNDQRR